MSLAVPLGALRLMRTLVVTLSVPSTGRPSARSMVQDQPASVLESFRASSVKGLVKSGRGRGTEPVATGSSRYSFHWSYGMSKGPVPRP